MAQLVRIHQWLQEKTGIVKYDETLRDPRAAAVRLAEFLGEPFDAPFSGKLGALDNAVHKTELGGQPVKLVWSLLGLVPLLLFLSGVQIWWVRKQNAMHCRRLAQDHMQSADRGSSVGAAV